MTVPWLCPFLLVMSIWILLRGHNAPGGGFIGGLVAAAAIAFWCFARGVEDAKRWMRVSPLHLMIAGVSTALISGLMPMFAGKPMLTALWHKVEVPLLGKLPLGTPILFDIGVFFAVVGVTTSILFSLEEFELWNRSGPS
nr:Na+/H+ antiporter subunit B [Acanthopleuribacter pedis]